MITLNLFTIIMQRPFVKKDQLITTLFNFISRYNENNLKKNPNPFILSKQKVREEELDDEYHINFLWKLGGINTVR